MHEFMEAMREVFPQLLVQFEDFETSTALPLLQKYRNEHLCFNDGILVNNNNKRKRRGGVKEREREREREEKAISHHTESVRPGKSPFSVNVLLHINLFLFTCI